MIELRSARKRKRGVFKPRPCKLCKDVYTPNGPNQPRCKGCIPNDRFKEYYGRYRVSKKDWDSILEKQGGTCALCLRPPEHIDHDHRTGVVRGLLCAGCNLAVNRVEEQGWATRALNYVNTADTGRRVNESSGYWTAWHAEPRRKINRNPNRTL